MNATAHTLSGQSIADPSDAPACFDDDATRWQAVRQRSPSADGVFLYAVATTGVYCHPSCGARLPRRENVRFFPDRAGAEAAGFRSCKRCRPDLPPRAEREAALVARSCRSIEQCLADGDEMPSLEQLAAAAGLSAFHFHRLFRRVAGVTPHAYAGAWKARRVRDGLRPGTTVTTALHDAGYGSSGRFYAAADGVLGMAPAAFRAGAPGEAIQHATAPCGLGTVLVATAGRGLCAILLGDGRDDLLADLRRRFPGAALTEADAAFGATVAAVVALVDAPALQAGVRPGAALPLDIRGTAFQRRVWEALRDIPVGETRSYAQVAAALGQPRAVRAVAGACAANALAVAIPCHRVVASDGGLGGYRWGTARKRTLLARERA